jgi:hypothetical protein
MQSSIMKKVYGLLGFLCFVAAVYLIFFYSPYKKIECGENCFTVELGKNWKIDYSTGYKSINGLAKFIRSSVKMVNSNNDTIELAHKILNEHTDFENGIATSGVSVKGINISSITKEVVIKYAIQIPENKELLGNQFDVISTAVIEYPDMVQIDDVIERSTNKKMTYTLKEQEVKAISKAFFVTPVEINFFIKYRKLFGISLVCVSLLLIVMSVSDNKEEKTQ